MQSKNQICPILFSIRNEESKGKLSNLKEQKLQGVRDWRVAVALALLSCLALARLIEGAGE